jgi:hypothetical protein
MTVPKDFLDKILVHMIKSQSGFNNYMYSLGLVPGYCNVGSVFFSEKGYSGRNFTITIQDSKWTLVVNSAGINIPPILITGLSMIQNFLENNMRISQ